MAHTVRKNGRQDREKTPAAEAPRRSGDEGRGGPQAGRAMYRGQRAEERRRELIRILRTGGKPLTGMELAHRVGVSRQMITQDINVLRASGVDILATPYGYLLNEAPAAAHREVLTVQHAPEAMEDELSLLVDLGLRVVDVSVEHPVYGRLRAEISVASRHDVHEMIERLAQTGAVSLPEITGGKHSHLVEAPRSELIELARAQLRERGYLVI